MMVIVKDGTFVTDTVSASGLVEIASDTNPADLLAQAKSAAGFRILFPGPADGRGFSIASVLRQHGFTGHLRASGHILADQYPLALRNGFDDIEIDEALAARQPAEQWRDAMARAQHTYREGLMQRPTAA